MIRFLMAFILMGLGIATFFMFTNPLYTEIQEKRLEMASYNEALDNSKALENERDNLTKKYNTISQENLSRIEKFLPENIDNIRLILEIEKIASPYGMALKDVKYDTVLKDSAQTGTIQGGGLGKQVSNKDYGTWNLEFSTTGSYNNFLNFTRDLENNLRIVDISSISFSSSGETKLGSQEVYKYNFKIKTYWLKN